MVDIMVDIKDPQTKCVELAKLLLEARDALPAIPLAKAKFMQLDLTLANRIEDALEPWRDKNAEDLLTEKEEDTHG